MTVEIQQVFLGTPFTVLMTLNYGVEIPLLSVI